MEPDQKPIHILLIDDDEHDFLILRDYLKELRSQTDYILDWAQTYQAGLLQIQHAGHDVYLVNHTLGAFSGMDFLQEAVQSGCQAPFIILTGQSDREIEQAALMAGATDYLVKGMLDGQLLARSIRYALERNRLLNKIRELAVRDALTGLYNRREMYRFLDYQLIVSRRYNHPFSLLMMDIDHFKEINDRFGHRIGDEIIQQVAQALLNNIRGCDLAVRYAGDEFIIVLPETPANKACYPAERIRKVVEALAVQVSNENGLTEQIITTLSIGVAEYPGDANSGDALIDMAGQALHQAKQLGCNQVVQFQAGQEKEQGSK
jgi:diguanylate cyclase (GGDEF)-like protein